MKQTRGRPQQTKNKEKNGCLFQSPQKYGEQYRRP